MSCTPLLGVHVDAPQGKLALAPPQIPVKVPLFSRLFQGQVEFSSADGHVDLRLTNHSDRACRLRELSIRTPGISPAKCILQQGEALNIRSDSPETTLQAIVIPLRGQLKLHWDSPTVR